MNHIKSLLLTTAIIISIVSTANAQPTDLKPLKENTIVCESKKAHDEFIRYAADGDTASIKEELLQTSRCIMVHSGMQYRILDTSIMGWAKIKIYGKGIPNGQVVWTMKNEL